jgi:Caspase domain
MRRPVFRDLLLLSGLLLFPQISITDAASAESRVALVVGQSTYRAVPALPNAANDAKRIAELLGSAGFEVTAAPDLSQNDMRQAISAFAAKVAASGPETVALVFYAGHGLQIDGENYLVPVDVDPKREADIPLQAVRLNDLMNTLGALPTRMRIFMLDACRNNPFPALNQTAGRGLAMVDTKAGAPGSLISFSTSPGAEAEDGAGADSPYTTALLSVAREPNLQIEEALKRVRVAVYKATEGRQVPWESSSLTTPFMFVSSGTAAGQGAVPSTPAKSVGDWRKDLQGKDAKVAYDLVIADSSVAALEAFTTLFAQSPYTPRARSLLERQREMLAWQTAVTINTAASFEVFLASYANSDLAATARKLKERVLNRSLGASAALTPTNVALTCPCSTPPTLPLQKKVDAPPATKKVEKSSKRRPPPDEVIVERGPSGPPPGAIMEGVGIGIGLGLGLGGGGMGGRGREGMPRSDNYRPR